MKKTFAVLAASSLLFALGACDVDQTEEGSMPDVDVEGGNLPEFDVEPADVDVGTETTTVEVPTVDINQDDAAGEPVTGNEE